MYKLVYYHYSDNRSIKEIAIVWNCCQRWYRYSKNVCTYYIYICTNITNL